MRDTIYDHYFGPNNKKIGEEYFDSRIITSGKTYIRLKIKKKNLTNCQLYISRIGQDFKRWWKRSNLKSSSTDCYFDVACYPAYKQWINEVNSSVFIAFDYTDAGGLRWIGRGKTK
jgi:hypothetical protein